MSVGPGQPSDASAERVLARRALAESRAEWELAKQQLGGSLRASLSPTRRARRRPYLWLASGLGAGLALSLIGDGN